MRKAGERGQFLALTDGDDAQRRDVREQEGVALPARMRGARDDVRAIARQTERRRLAPIEPRQQIGDDRRVGVGSEEQVDAAATGQADVEIGRAAP